MTWALRNNDNIFYIEENTYFIIGKIEKKLKQDINLKYSFFQIMPTNNFNLDIIDDDIIKCENIDKMKLDERIEINQFESINVKDLNINIFQNLSQINERLIIKGNDKKFIILLCEIDYNKQIAEDKIIENKINKIVNEIEIEFVNTKKNEFNFQIIN